MWSIETENVLYEPMVIMYKKGHIFGVNTRTVTVKLGVSRARSIKAQVSKFLYYEKITIVGCTFYRNYPLDM